MWKWTSGLVLLLWMMAVAALICLSGQVVGQGVGPGAEQKVLKVSPVVHVGISRDLFRSLKRAVEKAAQTPDGQPRTITLKRGEAEDLIVQAAQGMANGRRWVSPELKAP